MRCLALIAAIALVAIPSMLLADETPGAPTATPDKTSAPASTPAAPAPAADAAKAPAKAAAATAKAEEEWKPPLGYRQEKRDGVVVYCRRDVESGSRFQHKICYTREDLEFVIARNKEASDSLIRSTRVCGSAAVCANN
jgi:hypothetical protein